MLELSSGNINEYLDRTVMELNRILNDFENRLDGIDTINSRIADLDDGLSDLESRVEALENA